MAAKWTLRDGQRRLLGEHCRGGVGAADEVKGGEGSLHQGVIAVRGMSGWLTQGTAGSRTVPVHQEP
jgi:hypothetical protein